MDGQSGKDKQSVPQHQRPSKCILLNDFQNDLNSGIETYNNDMAASIKFPNTAKVGSTRPW